MPQMTTILHGHLLVTLPRNDTTRFGKCRINLRASKYGIEERPRSLLRFALIFGSGN